MLKALPAFFQKAVPIRHLTYNEWHRLYTLSRQTRPAVWDMTPDQFRKRILCETSPLCRSIQLCDPFEDTIVATCFLDSTLLHSPIGSRPVPYVTQLNRDLRNAYRGTGSLLLDCLLEKTSELYLKPANKELEQMYKRLGFFPTLFTGVGNPYFPIYGKSLPHD
jgi:hypothetical protein